MRYMKSTFLIVGFKYVLLFLCVNIIQSRIFISQDGQNGNHRSHTALFGSRYTMVEAAINVEASRPPRNCSSGCELYWRICTYRKYMDELKSEYAQTSGHDATALASEAINEAGYWLGCLILIHV